MKSEGEDKGELRVESGSERVRESETEKEKEKRERHTDFPTDLQPPRTMATAVNAQNRARLSKKKNLGPFSWKRAR